MAKINNYSFVNFWYPFLLLLLGLQCVMLLFFCMLETFSYRKWTLFLLVILIILTLIVLSNLRKVEIDASGEVITVRKNQIWDKSRKPVLEFPKSLLVRYKCKGGLLHSNYEFILALPSGSKKFRLIAFGISKNKIVKLKTSLSK